MSQPASHTPTRLGRWAPRTWCPPLAGVLLALAAPAVASGETAITTQAQADNGAFLAYAPPPAHRAGMCLIDTGVNPNPDTETTVVERVAIDGGSPNDVSPTLHGTVLAMMAAAPANGWGMIGTAPNATQIISVRILEPGQTTFPFSAYAAGIRTCLQMAERFDIKTINLSLGSNETPSSENSERVTNAIEEARAYGLAVVAAAGNDDGGAVGYPAAYPGVLSVAANDSLTGGFCSFSNRGAGLRLIAPGCDLVGADPTTGVEAFNYWQGTSEASDIADAALTALRAYRPDLSAEAAQEDLVDAHAGTLDIAQAFRDAGLEQIVSEGEAAEPRPTTTSGPAAPVSPPQSLPPSGPTPMSSTAETPFAVPRARLARRKGHLALVLASRPSGAHTEVRYLGRRGRSHKLHVLRTIIGSFTTLALPASGVLKLMVRYTDPYDNQRSSPWSTLSLRAPRAHHLP